MKLKANKIVAFLMALIMILQMAPLTVFAGEDDGNNGNDDPGFVIPDVNVPTISVKVTYTGENEVSFEDATYYLVVGHYPGNYVEPQQVTETKKYYFVVDNPDTAVIALKTAESPEDAIDEDKGDTILFTWSPRGYFGTNNQYQAVLDRINATNYEINVTDNTNTDSTYDVDISFFNENETEIVNTPSFYDDYYLIISTGEPENIRNIEDNTPYLITKLTDIKSATGTYRFSTDKMKIYHASGEDTEIDYINLTEQQISRLRAKLIHTNELSDTTLEAIKNLGNYDAIMEGLIAGYEPTIIHPSSATVSNSDTNYQINYRQINGNRTFKIKLRYPAGETTHETIESNKFYAWLKAYDTNVNVGRKLHHNKIGRAHV